MTVLLIHQALLQQSNQQQKNDPLSQLQNCTGELNYRFFGG